MMSDTDANDAVFVDCIRRGEEDAWRELIARYEGRLLAFVGARTAGRAAAEDVVQETFVGFLTSLPNYDARRPLESYLFSIAAHKLADHLRREGRRPTVPLAPASSRSGAWDQPGSARPASSIARSGERRKLEEIALVEAIASQIDRWRRDGQWQKLACIELLLVRGWTNKEVAAELNLGEQAVANHKFQFLATLRTAVRKQSLSEDVFPELYEERG